LFEFDVGLEFGIKCLHLGGDGLKLGFVLWVLEELGRFHELFLNVLHLFLEVGIKFLKLLLDFWLGSDELVEILFNLITVNLELMVNLVVHRELPHFGLWVEFEVVLELVVEGLHLSANLFKLSLKDWAMNVVYFHLESLVSHVHLMEFLGDIVVKVLELSLDLWLGEESLEVHHDGLLFLIDVSLEGVPSVLDLLELHSMFWGVELVVSHLESVADLHPVSMLVLLILLERVTEVVEWSFKVVDIILDVSFLFLKLSIDLWVHGELPHLKTLVVPVEVGLEFSVKSLPFGTNGLELSLVFWRTEHVTSLLKSLSDILEISFDLFSECSEFVVDLWVSSDEFFDILLDGFIVGSDFLELLIVHVEFPHLEALSVPFESFLDFEVESLHLSTNSLEFSFILWAVEHGTGLSKSSLDLNHLLVEDFLELLTFDLDTWVRVIEFLHVFAEGLILSFELLELLVVHGDGPQGLLFWGEDLAGGADGSSDEHHDCKFHFCL